MEKLSKRKQREYKIWKENIENGVIDLINENDYEKFVNIYEKEKELTNIFETSIITCEEGPMEKDFEKINICQEIPIKKHVEKSITYEKEKGNKITHRKNKNVDKNVDKNFCFTISAFLICSFCLFNFVDMIIYFTGI